MRHVNLTVKVGRAAQQCVGTFDYSDPAKAEANASALQVQKTGELLASGVDLSRVSFERVYVDENGAAHASPEFTATPQGKAKKGK